MKLRINGNSIRLRLTPSELHDLTEHGRVEEALAFPGGRRLHYALETSPIATTLQARFVDDQLTIHLPKSNAETWPQSDRVGFEHIISLEDGGELTILVEKDFKCLHKRPEDEDAFPHPMANQKPVP